MCVCLYVQVYVYIDILCKLCNVYIYINVNMYVYILYYARVYGMCMRAPREGALSIVTSLLPLANPWVTLLHPSWQYFGELWHWKVASRPGRVFYTSSLPRISYLFNKRLAEDPENMLSICLSIYLSVYLSIHPSIYLPIYLSMDLFIYRSTHLSIGLSILLPMILWYPWYLIISTTHLPTYLSLRDLYYIQNFYLDINCTTSFMHTIICVYIYFICIYTHTFSCTNIIIWNIITCICINEHRAFY